LNLSPAAFAHVAFSHVAFSHVAFFHVTFSLAQPALPAQPDPSVGGRAHPLLPLQHNHCTTATRQPP